MVNPEKLSSSGTQDEEKQNKTQDNVLDTNILKQIQITYIRVDPPLQTTGVIDEPIIAMRKS